MARAVVFDEIGGPEVLKIIDIPVADPGPGQVRVKVEAFGINRADQMMRSGVYAYLPQFPHARLGVEAAGVVDALGDGAAGLKPGQEVVVTAVPHMDLDGTYAQYVNLPASTVIPRPGGQGAVEAAATWIAYATAYGALVEKAGLRAGDHVLITAASSAVGLAAIQVANRVGAVPVAVTRGPGKRETLLGTGARHVIVSSEQDTVEAVRELTVGAGADIILDSVAGPGLPELAKAARSGGTIVMTGWLDTRPALLPMSWPLTVIGYVNFEHTLDPAAVARIAAFLDSGLRSGALSPAVSKVFPFDQVADAHRYLESGSQLGKVVVTT
jgi:NADPH:quinone reductase-like Zn-dependent oxidoreductase